MTNHHEHAAPAVSSADPGFTGSSDGSLAPAAAGKEGGIRFAAAAAAPASAVAASEEVEAAAEVDADAEEEAEAEAGVAIWRPRSARSKRQKTTKCRCTCSAYIWWSSARTLCLAPRIREMVCSVRCQVYGARLGRCDVRCEAAF